MAYDKHVAVVWQGAAAVREWQNAHPKQRLDLIEADLSGVDLSHADLAKADLSEANLSKAKLFGADLRNATLVGAVLSEADLGEAGLSKADLSEADLRSATLVGADLRNANLSGADLRDANLSETDLSNAQLIEADLSEADLSNADLRKAKLRGAKLRETILSGAKLIEADLTDAVLTKAQLVNADLSRANVLGADLSDANLTKADLRMVFIADEEGENAARFSNAKLVDAELPRSLTLAGGIGPSILDLATAEGLESAEFSPDVFEAYITEAFEYVHLQEIPEARNMPGFVSTALRRIKALRKLLEKSDPPEALVQVVHVITAELIKHLAAHPKALYEIRPRQFEELIAEILSNYGWEVHMTPETKDGGYDIFAITKDIAGVESAWMIECKKYAPHRKVGVNIVRSLFGIKTHHNVANAMLATTSHFTKGVHDYKASRYDLALRDYEGILEWINEYKPNPDGKLYLKDNKLVLPGEQRK